jgi:hypothetical protein
MRDSGADSPTVSGEECRTLSDGFHILRVLEEMTKKKMLPHESNLWLKWRERSSPTGVYRRITLGSEPQRFKH